jgi:hypothetical protein
MSACAFKISLYVRVFKQLSNQKLQERATMKPCAVSIFCACSPNYMCYYTAMSNDTKVWGGRAATKDELAAKDHKDRKK